MRPLRLELRGFTAFRRPAVVDFTGRTLFAITGPTGAGKSSLLDAMTWALYGQVPRVGRATHQLVTHGEKAMSVRFDFSARGHVYRVTRTTAGAIGTRLEQRLEVDGDHWRLVADRAQEVTKAIGTLVGLDYATFTKTIVLPQGEFGAFLRGEERERRDILSTLLGLEAYEAVGRAARGRSRESLQSVSLLTRQLERLTLATPEALAALEAERGALSARQTTSEAMRVGLAALSAAGEAHAASLRALEIGQRAADAAEQARVEAERACLAAAADTAQALEEHTRLLAERESLGYDADAHRRLREAAQLVEARESAATALDVARAAEAVAAMERTRAAQALAMAERQQETARVAADGACDALQRATAALCEAVRHARGVALGLAAAEARTERAVAEAEASALDGSRAAQQVEALAAEAASLAAAEAGTGRALAAGRAAAAAASGSEALAAEAAESARTGVDHARSHLDLARAEQAVGVLRAGLVTGDACPVCGTHVAQLPLHAPPDLATAEAAVAEAESILRGALEAQRAASASAATAIARLDALASEATRHGERRDALAMAISTLPVRCEVPTAEALSRVAAQAHESARAAQLAAQDRRTTLDSLRKAHHALDLRVAEAATRLTDLGADDAVGAVDDADFDAARAAAEALASAVGTHTARAAAATGALEQRRLAESAGMRAGEAVALAERTAADRAVATAAAERQLAALPEVEGGTQTAAELYQSLAAADALARGALTIDERLARAATSNAVLREREQERVAQRNQRVAAAVAAAAALAECAGAARETEAAFATSWRSLLGGGSEPDLHALRSLATGVETEARAIAQALGALEARLERAHAEAEEAAHLRSEVQSNEAVGRIAGALERELHADRFIAYVQREALGVLAADASTRLLHLTGGRYRLVGEADEFYVIDHLNGEERRSVRTLSGGETFLASLALALALSERLPELAGAGGALSLESLFLDEGFGSLDAASLDIAIEGLERLAGGRRLIGVISHVPEIAERLPDRIDIIKAPEGSSIAG